MKKVAMRWDSGYAFRFSKSSRPFLEILHTTIASYSLIAIGVLLATYAGYAVWFSRGDWLEIGIGGVGVIMAIAGIVLKRVADQATAK